MAELRPGETVLEFDPGAEAAAGLAFIGRIRSPWTDPAACPKNIGRARDTGQTAHIDLDPRYAPGLAGLSVGQPIILIYWMDRGRRDLIVQRPGHADGPRGTFALRSPMRPNLLALATVRITGIDGARIDIDAIDCLDDTPLVDIKPWLETVDLPPPG